MIEKWKSFKEKHVICFAVVLLIFYELLKNGVMAILSVLGIENKGTNFDYMWSEAVVLALAIFFVYATFQTHILKCGFKGFFKSLWSGMVFFLLAVVGCAMYAFQAMEQGLALKPMGELITFVVFVILVGLAEEIFFRGIIAESILKRFGNSVSGVIFSVILSGIIFGVVHILNFFSGQSLEESVIQAIATSMLGILLSAIYVRHRNIFGVAVLHALLDFMTMFTRGFFQGGSIGYVATDIDFWASLKQALISQSIFIIVALWVLRPKIIKKIVRE